MLESIADVCRGGRIPKAGCDKMMSKMFPNPLFLDSTDEDLTPGVFKHLSSMAIGSSW